MWGALSHCQWAIGKKFHMGQYRDLLTKKYPFLGLEDLFFVLDGNASHDRSALMCEQIASLYD